MYDARSRCKYGHSLGLLCRIVGEKIGVGGSVPTEAHIWHANFFICRFNEIVICMSIQLYTGASKRLKTRLSMITRPFFITFNNPWQNDGLLSRHLPWIDRRATSPFSYSPELLSDWVCVWSVVMLTPLHARAEAVLNLPSQISIV
jgi:hypothetical protein